MEGLYGKKPEKKDKPELTRKEKRAAIRAAFETYFPVLIGVIACFTVAILILWLWLS